MTKKEIQKKVHKIICKQLFLDSVKDSDYLLRDLGADSLDTAEIVLYLEEKFNIDIPETYWNKFQTVKEVVSYIDLRVNGRSK